MEKDIQKEAGDFKVLLIIPAFNEEGSIKGVVENIGRVIPQYDYVVINDGSSDSTSRICHDNGFNIIDLPVNLGLTEAVHTGMMYAWANGYDAAIQFDADGQHLPEYIPALAAEIQNGKDIAIGSRFVTKKKPWSSRMLGSRLISGMIRLTTGKKINDPTSGMRMYNRNVIELFKGKTNLTPEPDTVSYLMRSGYKVGEVQAEMKERETGESYLNLWKSVEYMFNILSSIVLVQPFRKKAGQ